MRGFPLDKYIVASKFTRKRIFLFFGDIQKTVESFVGCKGESYE
jgi:hypothetical protein